MAERSGIDYFSQVAAPVPHARTWHSQWIHGQDAPRFDTSTLGRALDELGRVGIGVAAKLAKADPVEKAKTGRRSLRARTKAARELVELRVGRAEDDPLEAPRRFDEGVSEIKRRTLEEIEDPDERAEAEVYLDSYAASERRQLVQDGLRRATADTAAALDASYELNLQSAAGAGSEAERVAAYARHLGDLGRAREQGWIGEAEHVARVERFLRAVELADAQALVAADPEAAIAAMGDEMFASLSDEDRAALSDTAERLLERNAREAETAPRREAERLLREGRLDADWLAANGELLSGADRVRFERAVAPAAATPDPFAYWRLLDDANSDPTGARNAVLDARGHGEIDDEQMRHLLTTADVLSKVGRAKPWVAAARGDLIARVRPGPLQDPRAASIQLEAVAEFDRWLAQNPEAGLPAARREAARIAGEHLVEAWSAERARLPLPRHAPASRGDFALDHLSAAAERLRAAYVGLAIDRGEFLREVELLRRWHDLLRRRPAEVK